MTDKVEPELIELDPKDQKTLDDYMRGWHVGFEDGKKQNFAGFDSGFTAGVRFKHEHPEGCPHSDIYNSWVKPK